MHAWWGSRDIRWNKTATNLHKLSHTSTFTHLFFHTVGCLTPVEQRNPPTTSSQSLLPSSFSHYADLFMNTAGSGDHIPFTTSGLDFQCSTSTVSLNCVTWMSGQIALRFESWGRFLCVYAHIRGGFHAKSYSCIRANDAISWYFLKANTPPLLPLSHPLSLSLSGSPPSHPSFTAATDVKTCLRQCSLLWQRAFFFFHLDHNGIIRLREIPCLRGFLDWFDKCPTSFLALNIIPYNKERKQHI